MPNLQFEASFKNEDKTGSRLFGRGFACSASWVAAGSCASSTTQWALLFLPEPVDSTIKQFEAKFNFSTERMLVTLGYYGSIYTNSNGNISPVIPGTLLNPLGQPQTLDAGLRTTLALPMALQPDNQAHQFYIAGNYRFMPGTTANFKYSYTHATQHEDFGSMGLFGAPVGRSSLDGELNTTLAQLGVTSRVTSALTLIGNVRYEDKENKTPIDYYNIEGVDRFTNGNPSPTKLAAKLDGIYQLPAGFRATLGVNYEHVDHGTFTPTDNVAGLSGLRQETKETGYKIELAKNLSETLGGYISYNHSKREGDSPWLKPLGLPLTGVIEADPDPACKPPRGTRHQQLHLQPHGHLPVHLRGSRARQAAPDGHVVTDGPPDVAGRRRRRQGPLHRTDRARVARHQHVALQPRCGVRAVRCDEGVGVLLARQLDGARRPLHRV